MSVDPMLSHRMQDDAIWWHKRASRRCEIDVSLASIREHDGCRRLKASLFRWRFIGHAPSP